MNAVDTNVFVYAFDDDEPIKQAKADELLARLSDVSQETVLLWQVATEFLAVLRKWQAAKKLNPAKMDAALHIVLNTFRLRKPNKRIFKMSMGLSSQFSLSHWDSMLLAACKDAGVDRLYTEDLDDETNYDGIVVVNPFL